MNRLALTLTAPRSDVDAVKFKALIQRRIAAAADMPAMTFGEIYPTKEDPR